MDYREEMKQLRDTLNAHGYRYYVLDDPQISDYEYDHMLRRLEDLEREHPEEITPDSPTRRVGGPILTQFQEVEHPVPLESLQDVFSYDELREFDERLRKDEPEAAYSVEPKNRWALGGTRVCKRRVCPRCDERRRAHRRGCDGKSQDRALHSAAFGERACAAHRPGRGIYAARQL